MELEELEGWAESFAAFCARFDDLFARSESRAQARKYLRGLFARLERKTTRQLAEVVKDGTPDRMQRLHNPGLVGCGSGPRPLAPVHHRALCRSGRDRGAG